MTPKRAEATCLMAASWRMPPMSSYHAGSSPPSPLLGAMPSRADRWSAPGAPRGSGRPGSWRRPRSGAGCGSAASTSDQVARLRRRGPGPAGRARWPGRAASAVAIAGQRVGVVAAPRAARSWMALTMGGAYRWRSPSARKRAQPGSTQLDARALDRAHWRAGAAGPPRWPRSRWCRASGRGREAALR